MSAAPNQPVNLDPFSIFLEQSASTPPNAGGVAPPVSESAPTLASGPSLSPDLPEVLSGSNPLAIAANPLLNLIPQIRVMVQHPDPAQLRNYLVEQMQLFERRAREAQVAPEIVVGARYALCTALDETAAKTPWGGGGAWSRHSLLVTFHNETWGGEKFFQVLARLVQDPKKHIDLIEMMSVCMALGFEGRFGVVDNGRTQLDTLRRRLVEIIAGARGEYPKALSRHWRGARSDSKAKWGFLPLWITIGSTLLLLAGIYLLYSFLLAGKSNEVFSTITGTRLPKATAPVVHSAPVNRFAQFLEPEIREGLVTVRDEADRSVIVLRGDGLFDSGSTDVKPRYLPVLSRVSDALNTVPGTVLISGYTDNVPIRTVRFPSNYELSQTRADVVRRIVEERLAIKNRIRAQGRADSDPVAPNDNSENRSRNRRVEVTLLLSPQERDRELNAVTSSKQ
jgi:type VI secretion system protein ImpK